MEIVPLSMDHKPDLPRELERIQKAGGSVSQRPGGVPRVYSPRRGGLAIARAFGDASFKLPRPVVTHTPEIVAERLGASGRSIVVVACDGVWDVMDNAQAAKIAAAAPTAEGASEALVREAYGLGSTDNITAIVVFVEPIVPGDPESGLVRARL
jgi:serine/threonine protein phosphatase PrpC